MWLTDQISDTCKVSFLISRLVVCSETVFFFPSLKLQTHIDVRRLLYPFVQSMGIQNPGDWSLVSYSSLLHPVWNNRISSFLIVLFTNLEWIQLVKISFVTSKYFGQFMRFQHFFSHAQSVCVNMDSQQNLHCSHIQRTDVDEDSYQLLHIYNHMIVAFAYIHVDLTYLCWFEYPMNRLKRSCYMAWDNGGWVNYLLHSLDVLPKWPPF